MKKSTAIWMAVACFFMGSVIGFLCAPIKEGISVRVCNNGNRGEEGSEMWEEEDDDLDELEF